jgi:hypothetical protein
MIDLHILLIVPAEIPPWAGAALWALLGLTGHSLPQWLFVATLENAWELRYISKRVLFETPSRFFNLPGELTYRKIGVSIKEFPHYGA